MGYNAVLEAAQALEVAPEPHRQSATLTRIDLPAQKSVLEEQQRQTRRLTINSSGLQSPRSDPRPSVASEVNSKPRDSVEYIQLKSSPLYQQEAEARPVSKRIQLNRQD